MKRRIVDFFDERIDLSPIRNWVQHKTVPQHKHSFWYYFGGLALFLITIQIITGILLAFYYSPNPANANESVRYIMEQVKYGWLIRSIHFWGANFLIAVVFVHMFSTYFMKAYRKPREIMWVLGVLIFVLVLTFSFTGYLLPWATLSYFATKVGVNTPILIPVIGNFISRIMQGGEDVGAATLTRMFTMHTVILPLTGIILISLHVFLSQVLGTSVPRSVGSHDGETKFFPTFLMRDAAVWMGTFAILVAFVTVFPANLGNKVNNIFRHGWNKTRMVFPIYISNAKNCARAGRGWNRGARGNRLDAGSISRSEIIERGTEHFLHFVWDRSSDLFSRHDCGSIHNDSGELMLALFIIQAEDTLSAKIPSFTERFNFTLPLIVILVIIMFFLLLKSYESERS